MQSCRMDPEPVPPREDDSLLDDWYVDDRSRGPWESQREFTDLYFSDLLVLWGDVKAAGAHQAGLLTRLDFDAFCAFAYRCS
jgi:hypothetical protein